MFNESSNEINSIHDLNSTVDDRFESKSSSFAVRYGKEECSNAIF